MAKTGIFGDLFDLDGDGNLDFFEEALEIAAISRINRRDEDNEDVEDFDDDLD